MCEKNINITIDKISLVGRIKDVLVDSFERGYYEYFDLLFSNVLLKDKIRQIHINNSQFSHSYMIEDLGFIQYGNKFNIRIEFNPNHLGIKQKEILFKILDYVYDIHFTRLDIALDLYNYKLEEYNIIDLKNRKKGYYYDNKNHIETIYIGSMKSSKFIRIYNKAKEQNLKGLDWWRLELQLRDVYIDQYLNSLDSFFEGIFIFKYENLCNYSVETKAMLEYLLTDISRLSELSKNARTRYKKIINNLQLESLNFIFEIVSVSKSKTIEYLNFILYGIN